MSDREVLSTRELNMLAKLAKIIYDEDILDTDQTSPEMIDLCRRCSEALGDGKVLAVTMSEMSILTALANRRKPSDAEQRVLDVIRDAGAMGIATSFIAVNTGLSQGTIKNHLAALKGMGLVEHQNRKWYAKTR